VAANRSVQAALSVRFDNAHVLARDNLALGMRQARVLDKQSGVLVLTDDFNPLDVLDTRLHENIRRVIVETTPAAILLHG
jgi:hypothetical protein